MALSGSFTGSICSGHYGIKVTWSATQSVANNTSTITAKLYLTGDWSLSVGERTHSLTIAGTETSISTSSINQSNGSWSILLGTATKTVTHDSDGSKSVALKGLIDFAATIQGTYYESISASATITLNTIPRATTPTLSASSVAMGNTVTISTPRASTSFKHTLKYTFGSASGTIATDVGIDKVWTVPLTLANQVPNATSGKCTITCITYKGSTKVGTKTVTLTLTVPSTVVPSISAITCTDPYGYATTYSGYVQNKSKVKVTATASGIYSSTIKSYKIVANGVTYSSNGITTGVLKTTGTNTIKVTVTDSRGRTASSSTTITVLAYAKPRISKLKIVRCLSDGTADEDGAYMKVTVAASITSLNSKNSKTFTLKYKLQSATSYTTSKTWTSAYSVSTSVIIAADINSSYDIQLTAKDSFSTTTADDVIGTAFTLMDFNATGKGMAVGKVSELDAFECGIAAIFSSCKTTSGADLDDMGTVGETNNNYFKIGNYVVQWGTKELSSRSSASFVYAAVTYPVVFKDTNYRILAVPKLSSSYTEYYDSMVSVASATTGGCQVRAYSPSGAFTTDNFPTKTFNCEWIAIGRYK